MLHSLQRFVRLACRSWSRFRNIYLQRKIAASKTFPKVVASFVGTSVITLYDREKLTFSHLIKRSATQTLGSATVLLQELIVAYREASQFYLLYLENTIKLYEEFTKAVGNSHLENKLWDLVVEERSKLNQSRENLLQLDIQIISSIKVLENATEFASQVGVEEDSNFAEDYLTSVQSEIQNLKEQCEIKVRELISMEVKYADKLGEYEK